MTASVKVRWMEVVLLVGWCCCFVWWNDSGFVLGRTDVLSCLVLVPLGCGKRLWWVAAEAGESEAREVGQEAFADGGFESGEDGRE